MPEKDGKAILRTITQQEVRWYDNV